MRFLIYGAGALGQAVGCILAAAGHRVDLILRQRFRTAILENGLAVTGLFGDYQVQPAVLGLFTSVQEIQPDHTAHDYVLITTKAYDTGNALKELSQIDNGKFQVVTMQNGGGNLEQVVDCFGEKRSLAARVITGFEILRPGKVRITVSADAIKIGGTVEGYIPPAAELLAEAIDRSGLPSQATAFVSRDLYAKLLYNCALNPLGAILGVAYGQLADDPDTRKIMDQVIDETFYVIRAMGAATHWHSANEYRKYFYEQQVPATYHHRPSMLQDLEQGKPTEIEALTGYIAVQGRLFNIPAPTCELLSALVRFRERQSNSSATAPGIPGG